MFPSSTSALPYAHLPFAVAWFARGWRRVAKALAERRRLGVASRELQSLDEHTLRDIGLSHRAAAQWPLVRHDAW